MNFRAGMILASVLSLFYLTACHRAPQEVSQNAGLLKQLDFELYLKAAGGKEISRDVIYWPGTRVLKQITVTYADGGLLVSTYARDGSISNLSEWYGPKPPADTQPNPAIAGQINSSQQDAGGQQNTSGGGGTPDSTVQPGSATNSPAVTPGNAAPTGSVTAPGNTAPTNSLPGNTAPTGSLPATTQGSKSPQLKRVIEYADGGVVNHARFFRFDGSLQAEGRRKTDGTFALNNYAEDGRSLVLAEVFLSDGEPFYVHVLQGEPIKTITRKTKDGNQETVTFSHGYRVTRAIQRSNFEDTEFYKEDGKTLSFIAFRHYKISALYLNDDGTLDQLRSFDTYQMKVVKYRPGVRMPVNPDSDAYLKGEAYRQFYQVTHTPDGKESVVLARVEEVNEAGKVIRKLQFSDQGQLTRVEYIDQTDGSLLKVLTLRDNGTVERIDEYHRQPSAPTTVTTTDVDESKGMREQYDQRLVQPLPYTDPRPLVGPPVPQTYNYDEMDF